MRIPFHMIGSKFAIGIHQDDDWFALIFSRSYFFFKGSEEWNTLLIFPVFLGSISCHDNHIFEAVVERMGSMLQKHMKPEHNCTQSAFEDEMHIDWNGPVVSRADPLLSVSLYKRFASRKRWNFKTGSSKFYTSQVVDRKKSELSRLSFFNKTQ